MPIFGSTGAATLSDVLTLLDGPPFDIFRDGDHDARPDRHGQVERCVTELPHAARRRDTPATLAEMGLSAEAVVTGFASDTLVPGTAPFSGRPSVRGAECPRA
jgi:hypothetical protein